MTDDNRKTALRIKNLTFGYHEMPVLKDISFEVETGSVLCLLGNNGSGKTTLLDCLLGINKAREGKIELFGKAMKHMSVKKRAGKIAYIPQHHKESFPYTVEEIVLMGRNPYLGAGQPLGKEDYRMADRALGVMEIRHLKHRIYSKLSGGERQMVLLARAYVQNTDIIIMDEPTTSLDLKNERLLLGTLEDLVVKEKKTIVMSSHSMNHPLFLEHRQLPVSVVMLKEGRIAFQGKALEILNESNIREVYGVACKVMPFEEKGVPGHTVVTL